MFQELKFKLSTAILIILTIAAAYSAVINFEQQHKFRLADDGAVWVDRGRRVEALHIDPDGPAAKDTGLARSRSAAHVMLASLCILAVAAIAYVIFGFSWQGAPGRPAHVLTIGGRVWNWIAAEPLFLRGLRLDLSPASL